MNIYTYNYVTNSHSRETTMRYIIEHDVEESFETALKACGTAVQRALRAVVKMELR